MVKYIEPEELAVKIRERREKLLIVDVRDHDFQGGKVKSSINVPYCDLQKLLPELLNYSKKFQIIIFHCHFSAQRGPSAAQIFEDSFATEVPQVLVLRGGYKYWRKLYQSEDDLYEQT